MLGWSLLGRLPLGMTPLALLFLIRGEGRSYAAAGIVVALYAVAVGVGAPIAGRQVDRFGPTPVLRVRAVAYALLAGTVVALAVLDAGIVAVAAAAALGGLALPPLSSTVRIVWPRLAPDELRSTAYALEASLQEVFFVGGPLLAAALATVSPAAGLAGAGLASLVGATATALLPPVRETPPSRAGGAGLLGALGSPGVRTVVLYAATVGVGFGSVELAMPAFAEAHGSRELGGLALASFSGGSLVGGLVAGMRPPRSVLRRFVLGSLVLAAALLGLLLAVSIPTLCLLAFVAGLPIAPRSARCTPSSTAPRARGRPRSRSPGSGRPSRSASPPARRSPACSSTSTASAPRSPPGRPSPSAARSSAGRGAGRCGRLPPEPSQCLRCSRSARSSGDRAADF